MPPPSLHTTPRLVFLHIPKTAGTSLREIVRSVYGDEATFWYNLKADTQLRRKRWSRRPYDESTLAGKVFLGGHKPLDYYPASTGNLYCATVRDPVQRVQSFFSYLTRPTAASGEWDRTIRQQLRESWIKRGIVPESLVRSIEQCKDFRAAIENQQCAYLSRRANTFEAAMRYLHRENFLVGDSAQLTLIVNKLATLFDWPETPKIIGNVSRPGQNDDIVQEPGAIELINECCAEDRKLYDFICNERDGLFEHIPDYAALSSSELRCVETDKREFSRLAWGKVSLSAAPLPQLPPDGHTNLPVTVKNTSREYMNPDINKGIFLGYKLLDKNWQVIAFECVRTPMNQALSTGQEHTQDVRIEIPAEYRDEVAGIRLSMLHAGKYWIDSICPNHAIDLPLGLLANGDNNRQDIPVDSTRSGRHS
jgi:hypothetical protein